MPIPGITASSRSRGPVAPPNVLAVDANGQSCYTKRTTPFVGVNNDEGTFSFWIKTTNTTDNQDIIFFDQASNSAGRMLVRTQPSGRVQAVGYEIDNVTNWIAHSDTTYVNDGEWHHIFISYRYSTLDEQLYVDGVNVAVFQKPIEAGGTDHYQCAVLAATNAGRPFIDGEIAQLWWKNEYISPMPTNLQHFYNNGSVTFRDDGTTGCWSPELYFSAPALTWNSGNQGFGGDFDVAPTNDVVAALSSPPNATGVIVPGYAEGVLYQSNTSETKRLQPLWEQNDIPDGMKGTVSFWWHRTQAASGYAEKIKTTGDNTFVFTTYSNGIWTGFYIYNEANQIKYAWRRKGNNDTLAHIMVSWDFSVPVVYAYYNGSGPQGDIVVQPALNTVVPYSNTTGMIFMNAGIDQDYSDVFFHDDFIDLSVEENRALFYDNDNNAPVDMGTFGDKPFGVKPRAFLRGEYPADGVTPPINYGSLGPDVVYNTTIPTKQGYVKDVPAVVFDGSSNWLECDTSHWEDGNKCFLSVWFYPLTFAGSDLYIIGAQQSGNDPRTVLVRYTQTGTIYIQLRNAANTSFVNASSTVDVIEFNTWNHLLYSYDGDTLSHHIYLNEADVTATPTTLLNDTIKYSINEFVIGDLKTNSRWFNGDMAELYLDDIYYDITQQSIRDQFALDNGDNTFQPQRVLAPDLRCPKIHFSGYSKDWALTGENNRGTGGDFTVNGILFNSANTPISAEGPPPPPYAQGIVGDGSAYGRRTLSALDPPSTNTMTFSCWAKWTNSTNYITLLDLQNSINSYNTFRVYSNAGFIYATFGSTNGSIFRRTASAFNNNVWHHIYIIAELATPSMNIYIDGVETNVDVGTPDSGSLVSYGQGSFLTSHTTPGSFTWDGELSQLWFDGTANTIGDLSKFYDSGNHAAVDLGGNGEIPNGTSPFLYFTGPASGVQNLGRGGSYTITGTFTDSAVNPSNTP